MSNPSSRKCSPGSNLKSFPNWSLAEKTGTASPVFNSSALAPRARPTPTNIAIKRSRAFIVNFLLSSVSRPGEHTIPRPWLPPRRLRRLNRLLLPHFHHHHVHPALVRFLDIIHLPILPSPAPGLMLRQNGRRLLQKRHARRPRHRRALSHTNFKFVVGYILDRVLGLNCQVLVEILVVRVLLRCGTSRTNNQ